MRPSIKNNSVVACSAFQASWACLPLFKRPWRCPGQAFHVPQPASQKHTHGDGEQAPVKFSARALNTDTALGLYLCMELQYKDRVQYEDKRESTLILANRPLAAGSWSPALLGRRGSTADACGCSTPQAIQPLPCDKPAGDADMCWWGTHRARPGLLLPLQPALGGLHVGQPAGLPRSLRGRPASTAHPPLWETSA